MVTSCLIEFLVNLMGQFHSDVPNTGSQNDKYSIGVLLFCLFGLGEEEEVHCGSLVTYLIDNLQCELNKLLKLRPGTICDSCCCGGGYLFT